MMKLMIKNMVCPRCTMSVKAVLVKQGLRVKSVELGEAEIENDLTQKQLSAIENKFSKLGFELIKDHRLEVAEKIKNLIVELVYWSDDQEPINIKYSDYISQNLKLEYHYLSGLFSEVAGITIEKYMINQRIERAKELISYGDLTLQAIALKLNYNSIHHFSNQFKSITGLSPTAFTKLKEKKRKGINEI